jgi:hypothetical protein
MPSRPAPTWNVYRNGILTPELQPLIIQRSLNGERMDYAELIVDTRKYPSFNGLDDFSAFPWLGHTLEIGFSTGGYVHRGTIVQAVPKFNRSEAGIKIVSRTEPHQFGLTLFGQAHFNPINGQFFITDDELVFNPTIDGKTKGNKHDSKTYGPQQMPVFLSPEATRTEAARTLQGGQNVSWTLSEVLFYLCWMANREQTFLVNPTLAELQTAVVDSVDLVRDLKIKAGSNLPEALDAVLGGLGYFWRLVQVGAFSLNKIEIIRRSTGGALTWLNHQRIGSKLNTSATNTESMGVRFDTTRLANQIVAKGGKIQVEITAELHRGWPSDLDDEPLESLELSAAKLSENPEKINAWRKWVLNEAGDYIGVRDDITDYLVDDVREKLQEENLLRWFLPRRRNFMPTLTTVGEVPIGDVNGILVEYKDYAGEWKSAKEWGIQLLDNECGIRLTGSNVPEELYDQGADAAIRVTATIEGDYRLTYTAGKQADSPIFAIKEAYVDLEDSYQHRIVLPGSKYADGGESIAADDTYALEAFATSLRSRFDQIDIPGGIVIEGLDWFPYYQPGDRVRGVEGKNISFAVKPGTDQYPQIVSVTLDIENQKTILQLQRFREFRA